MVIPKGRGRSITCIKINWIKIFFVVSIFNVGFLSHFSQSYLGNDFPVKSLITVWENPYNLLTDGNLTYHLSNYLHIDPLSSDEHEIVFKNFANSQWVEAGEKIFFTLEDLVTNLLERRYSD